MTNLQRGSQLGPWRFDGVVPEALAEMAVVLDDPNPIHLDASVVSALGMGARQINQGPSNVGYIMNMIIEAIPGAQLERFEARFITNVFAGDTVIACGIVEAIEDSSASCRVWLDVDGSTRSVDGRATVRIPL